jgi:hypothetical protein
VRTHGIINLQERIMSTSTTLRGGIVATSLLGLLTVGTTVSWQSQEPKATTDAASKSYGQDLEPLRQAYRQLHEKALRSLKDGTRGWPAGSTSSAGDTNRTGSTGATSQAISFREDDRLVAACSDGLLAGAPTTGTSFGRESQSRSNDPTGPNDQGERASNDPSRRDASDSTRESSRSGELVGMIIVCTHSVDGTDGHALGGSTRESSRPEEASTSQPDRSTGVETRTSAGTRKLEPGVYAVRASAGTVQLTDKSGQIVLTAMLGDPGLYGGSSQAGTSGADHNRPQGTSEGRPAHVGIKEQSWGHIFGAITKEAMTSMGWSKSDHSMSTSR